MARPEYHPAVKQGIRDLSSIIVPAFQRESVDEHVAQLMAENEGVRRALEFYPGERATLERIAHNTYNEHHKYIGAAKVVDTIDRTLAVLTGIGEYVPAVGTLFRWGENAVELIPKAAYALWYAAGTKDYKSLPYFAVMEALSFTPFAGTVVDMMNIYLNRARMTYRNTVAERFIASFTARQERNALGQPRGAYIDAEVVPPRQQLPGTVPAPQNDIERAIASIKVIPERDTTTR